MNNQAKTEVRKRAAVWRLVVVPWVVVVVAVAEGLPSTRFVRLAGVLPAGEIYVYKEVSSPVACCALCQLHEPCEAFLLRHLGEQRRQMCTVMTQLSIANWVTDEYEERAYAAEYRVPEVLSLLPPREEFEEFETEQNIEKETEKCGSDRAVAGLALPTGDTTMNTVDYFECRKITHPFKMSLDTGSPPMVETMPPEACPDNRVLGGFKAFSDGSHIKRWRNPPVLQGICYLLEKFLVDYSRCENVTASRGPWIGQENKAKTSSGWDTIFYCPVGSLAVGMSRELDGDSRRIVNLMCCYVDPQPQ